MNQILYFLKKLFIGVPNGDKGNIDCPHCHTKLSQYPRFRPDGTRHWRNTLIGNPILFAIFISLMVAVYGVNTFTEDCMQIKDYPGQFCDQWCDFKFQNAVYDNTSFRGYSLPDNVTFNFTIDS